MIFLGPMDAIRSLCGFTDALERLLASADAVAFERTWCEDDLDQVGWEALALGRRATGAGGVVPAAERSLTTRGAHHAVVAAAVEAARYYPGQAGLLVELFQRIRGDEMLRRFLGPRILESLYVLCDPRSLPLFEQLLVTGHTDPDLERCEVTRALVAVRKLTGRLAPNSKFADAAEEVVQRTLDDAERRFEEGRDRIVPVNVI